MVFWWKSSYDDLRGNILKATCCLHSYVPPESHQVLSPKYIEINWPIIMLLEREYIEKIVYC